MFSLAGLLVVQSVGFVGVILGGFDGCRVGKW
jgi:hypothetical protein